MCVGHSRAAVHGDQPIGWNSSERDLEGDAVDHQAVHLRPGSNSIETDSVACPGQISGIGRLEGGAETERTEKT